MIKLCELLSINRGITAFIGGGGKTSLIRHLSRELREFGTVISVTTTHFLPFDDMDVLSDSDLKTIRSRLITSKELQIGTLSENGKLTAPGISFEDLINTADYILVEADGSKHLPLKAHYSHEPVIPKLTKKVVCVVGADGINGIISDVCHRYDKFCEICRCCENDIATPKIISDAIKIENLSDCVFINRIDLIDDNECIYDFKKMLNIPVFYGSIKEGKWQCL